MRRGDVYQRNTGNDVETLILRAPLSERRRRHIDADWTAIVVRPGSGGGCNQIPLKVEELATGGWRKLELPSRGGAGMPVTVGAVGVAFGGGGGSGGGGQGGAVAGAVGGNGGGSSRVGAAGGATWSTWTSPDPALYTITFAG